MKYVQQTLGIVKQNCGTNQINCSNKPYLRQQIMAFVKHDCITIWGVCLTHSTLFSGNITNINRGNEEWLTKNAIFTLLNDYTLDRFWLLYIV